MRRSHAHQSCMRRFGPPEQARFQWRQSVVRSTAPARAMSATRENGIGRRHDRSSTDPSSGEMCELAEIFAEAERRNALPRLRYRARGSSLSRAVRQTKKSTGMSERVRTFSALADVTMISEASGRRWRHVRTRRLSDASILAAVTTSTPRASTARTSPLHPCGARCHACVAERIRSTLGAVFESHVRRVITTQWILDGCTDCADVPRGTSGGPVGGSTRSMQRGGRPADCRWGDAEPDRSRSIPRLCCRGFCCCNSSNVRARPCQEHLSCTLSRTTLASEAKLQYIGLDLLRLPNHLPLPPRRCRQP